MGDFSSNARPSPGGVVGRSNTSVMGMRMGSSSSVCISLKNQKPGPASGTGQKNHTINRYCAHLTLSNLLSPGLAHDRFHLIFQAEFQFLQPHFLQLLLIGKMGK